MLPSWSSVLDSFATLCLNTGTSWHIMSLSERHQHDMIWYQCTDYKCHQASFDHARGFFSVQGPIPVKIKPQGLKANDSAVVICPCSLSFRLGELQVQVVKKWARQIKLLHQPQPSSIHAEVPKCSDKIAPSIPFNLKILLKGKTF